MNPKINKKSNKNTSLQNHSIQNSNDIIYYSRTKDRAMHYLTLSVEQIARKLTHETSNTNNKKIILQQLTEQIKTILDCLSWNLKDSNHLIFPLVKYIKQSKITGYKIIKNNDTEKFLKKTLQQYDMKNFLTTIEHIKLTNLKRITLNLLFIENIENLTFLDSKHLQKIISIKNRIVSAQCFSKTNFRTIKYCGFYQRIWIKFEKLSRMKYSKNMQDCYFAYHIQSDLTDKNIIIQARILKSIKMQFSKRFNLSHLVSTSTKSKIRQLISTNYINQTFFLNQSQIQEQS